MKLKDLGIPVINATREEKPLQTYQIEIVETLSEVIDIEAESEDDAINQVRSKYNNEEIILDSSNNYVDTNFNIFNG